MATGTPQRPPSINLDAAGEWLWELVVESLPAGALGWLDAAVLLGLCQSYSMWLQFEVEIDDVTDPAEKRRLIRTANSLWDRFSRDAAKFGMNPSDRARLKAQAGDPILEMPLNGGLSE